MNHLTRDLFTSIERIWTSIPDYFTAKSVISVLSPLALLAFGSDHVLIMKSLVLLTVIDFVTGIWSARSVGEIISSRNAIRSAYKLVMYGLLVAGSHLTEVIIPGQSFLEELMTSFLAATELISILENTGKMGYAIPSKLLLKLQEYRDQK